jgi:hypothetical protein
VANWKQSHRSLSVQAKHIRCNGQITKHILYLLKCKMRFLPLNLALKCDVLNSCMNQTRLLWTRPWQAKPRPASPSCLVRSPLFWDITQHRVIIPYWGFGKTYWSCLQEIQTREHSMCDVNSHNLLFWNYVHCLIFLIKAQCFKSQLCFSLKLKKHLTWQTTYTDLFSSTGHCRNIYLLWYVL